ncbi:hypothetical protein TNCV_516621 [Trichonephila clavipes]|nr:hypothetical protein TNCV_516621 [Trichonephila clavipes]
MNNSKRPQFDGQISDPRSLPKTLPSRDLTRIVILLLELLKPNKKLAYKRCFSRHKSDFEVLPTDDLPLLNVASNANGLTMSDRFLQNSSWQGVGMYLGSTPILRENILEEGGVHSPQERTCGLTNS